MEVLDAKVNWYLGYANDPELELLVDRFPGLEEFEFEQRDDCWFAEKDEAVYFLHHSGKDENEGGFYGAEFRLRTKTGEVKALLGPWSSRAGVMNKVGFTPCLDVSYTDEVEAFKRGYFTGGHVTLHLALHVIKRFLPGIHLARIEEEDGEVRYVPSLSPERVEKPKGFCLLEVEGLILEKDPATLFIPALGLVARIHMDGNGQYILLRGEKKFHLRKEEAEKVKNL